jgi:hypothetical protein
MTTFAGLRQGGAYAFYRAQDRSAFSTAAFLCPSLAFAPAQPPVALSLSDLWSQAGHWVLLIAGAERAMQLDDAAADQLAALTGLADLGDPPDRVLLAWWPAQGDPARLFLDPAGGGHRQVGMDARLPLGNLELRVPAQIDVTLADADALTFARDAASQLVLNRAAFDEVTSRTLDGGRLVFSPQPDGAPPGTLCAPGMPGDVEVVWAAVDVLRLGQEGESATILAPEIRYFRSRPAMVTPDDLDWAGVIRLPLFEPFEADAQAGLNLNLTVRLNPALPFEPDATRVSIVDRPDAPLPADVVSAFTASGVLRAADGTALTLTPVSRIGFALAPAGAGDGTPVYLAPAGRFALSAGPAATPSPTPGPARLMPGLSALEFVEVQPGDLIELVPGQPAFGVTADPATGAASLESTLTTSWLRVLPGAGAKRGYFAQPLASVFYGSAGADLPRAADALVTELSGTEAPYPWAPYGRALLSGVNPKLTADDISTFESQFLASTRGKLLGADRPPVFHTDGAPLGGLTATPRGLLGTLAPVAQPRTVLAAGVAAASAPSPAPGTWTSLTLARGNGLAGTVALGPGLDGTVDPGFANALMQPSLFLVFDNWSRPGFNMTGSLDIGGFTFDWRPVAPAAGRADAPTLLLVAKFTTTMSLPDLFASPSNWRGGTSGDFLDAAGVAAAQAAFATALATAKQHQQEDQAASKPSGLFSDFLNRICDPAWTGILLLNAPVDGKTLPAGIQVMLAGLQAPLVAHHVAVDVTELQATTGAPSQPGPSSIAAVIAYEDLAPTPVPLTQAFAFRTRRLEVAIAGSTVTSVVAEVGATLNQLFHRPVRLTDAVPPATGTAPLPNTVILQGVYQDQGGVPSVSFVLPTPHLFAFVRDAPVQPGGELNLVLDKFQMTGARLLPQASAGVASGAGTQRSAQIVFDGQLWFVADPFGVGLDLFAYGTPGADGAGLTVSNIGIELTYSVTADGQPTGEPATFAADWSRVQATESSSAERPGSLLRGLPLKLSGFLASEKGLDPTRLGGQPVHCPDIADKVTVSPCFALQFDLLIGSLGALGASVSLTAGLALGWGPRSTIPDADGAMLTIRLPGASAGYQELTIQGLIKLVFGDATLMKIAYTPPSGGAAEPVFALLFSNVALSVLGIKLPPKVVSNLVLFSDPAQPASSNLAFCLAVSET